MSSDDAATASSPPEGAPEDPQIRKITDARTLRALAHPVRIALFEELALGGAMTATQVGERIGESATTCSFHLRQLAKYGFVEEAGGGPGRSRPWRLTSIGMSFSPGGDADGGNRIRRRHPACSASASSSRYQTWRSTKAPYPQEWRQAATDSQYLFYLTRAGAQGAQPARCTSCSTAGDARDGSPTRPGARPARCRWNDAAVPPGRAAGVRGDPGDA